MPKVSTSSTSTTATAYEALRLSNIARNNAMLVTLGLTAGSSAFSLLAQTPTDSNKRPQRSQKRKRVDLETANNTLNGSSLKRSSQRLQNLQFGTSSSDGLFIDQLLEGNNKRLTRTTAPRAPSERKYGTIKTDDKDYLPTHFAHILNEEGFDASTITSKWDKSKVHQHLTLSKSCRTVVTTGCAGIDFILAALLIMSVTYHFMSLHAQGMVVSWHARMSVLK
jgi:hypothetical protein